MKRRPPARRSLAPPSQYLSFPLFLLTWDVCRASSRVGTRMRAWISLRAGSTRSRTGMVKAAVLPVPFLARARMSRPVRAMGMDSSWMGDGLSKPCS